MIVSSLLVGYKKALGKLARMGIIKGGMEKGFQLLLEPYLMLVLKSCGSTILSAPGR